ncbi:DNA-directed RNA polymerase [Candidatus Woesearchaeota archaeon]|nr:DNA-directed RNA polymerase [Candidatus Woesearchaeota archaeon]
MFYKSKIKDHIRVPPSLFNLTKEDAVLKQVKAEYEGFISKDLGMVIDVSQVDDIREGIIIPGDGASYYETEFELLTFKPELQEVVTGAIKDIADFGAFFTLGPTEGMIHISQTMDDFVSFAKDKVLTGKETKRALKVGDKCKARIIAVSYKDPTNPKLGLTMRQPSLGKIEWIKEDHEKEAAPAEETEEKEEKKEAKPKEKKESKPKKK